MELFIIIFFSYLIGSIPFGYILTKIFLKTDIRNIGSGNIGATNVLRTGNKLIGYSTLILDILKTVLPLIFIKVNYHEYIYVSSLCIFIGHVFPLWLNFKGGKGVATYVGILFCINIFLGFIFIISWFLVYIIFKYSSLSSMFASLTVFVVNGVREVVNPFISAISKQSHDINTSNHNITFLLFVFFVLIIFTHRRNITNLKNKTEDKIKI